MATAISNISSILECKVCLRMFRDPKMLLPCHHMFCKECLESIMKFREDGSIDITCPNRCPDEMHIDRNKTVNDLGTAYEVKAIIETLKRSEEESSVSTIPRCQKENNCNKEICVYCCRQKMCKSCYLVHVMNSNVRAHNGGKKASSIMMDEESGSMVVMCEEHLSRCTHVCPAHFDDDVTFLCKYCLNRDHKGHLTRTIEEHGIKLKENLNSSSANMDKLGQVRKVTEEQISLCTTKLNELLRHRKQMCVSKYIDLLNGEEESMKSNVKRSCDAHLSDYPSVIWTNFYEENSAKDGIDLVIDQGTILNTIGNHSEVAAVSISLGFSVDIKGEHPLGALRSTRLRSQQLHSLNPSIPTLRENITAMECQNREISSKLLQQLKDLMEEEETANSSQLCCEKSGCASCSLTKDLKKVDENKLKFIEELIHSNQVSRLGTILAARPDVLKWRGADTYTILHYAVAGAVVERVDGRTTDGCLTWLCKHFPYLMEVGCEDGYTPLHCVAQFGQLEPAKILLSCGANPHAKNCHGKTPLDIANENGHTQCAEELQKWIWREITEME